MLTGASQRISELPDPDMGVQHRAPGTSPKSYGFEAGRPVPVVWPGEAEAAQPGGLTIGDMLEYLLTAATTAEQIGARAVLLAYLLHVPNAPQSLRQLGDLLGCSHETARTKLDAFRAILVEYFHHKVDTAAQR